MNTKFNKKWTRRAVLILRNAQNLVFEGVLRQKRSNWGQLDANGHGEACATQVLFEFLDALRDKERFPNRGAKEAWINANLPINTSRIISLNDEAGYTYAQIAREIENAAGGPAALEA